MNETMEREIHAQATVLPEMLPKLIAAAAALPIPTGRIFAGGCGDSAFAPAALIGMFDSLDLRATTAMELAHFTRLRPGDTVLLSSISGNTRRTVEAAEMARRTGAQVIAVTCGSDSRLPAAADATILLPFTPISRKTPHTLDYTATLLALAVLALSWRKDDPKALHPALDALPMLLDAGRNFADQTLAGMTEDAKIFLIGAGPDLATASYGAAKFHEAGGRTAIAAETENFIHGANFMVEPADTLIAVATNPESLRRGTQVADALRPLAATARLLTPPKHDLEGPTGNFADLLAATLSLQLLCWQFACRSGSDVEAPRAGRPRADRHMSAQSELMRI